MKSICPFLLFLLLIVTACAPNASKKENYLPVDDSVTSPAPVEDDDTIVYTGSHDDFGNLVYDIPDTMKVGEKHLLTIRILDSGDTNSLTEGLSENAVVTEIRTAPTMQVEVVSPDKSIEVTPVHDPVQLVDSIEYTQWDYNIVPTRKGNVMLKVIAYVITEGGKKSKTFDHNITVIASAKVAVKNVWQKIDWKWAFSALIIPVFLWVWNRRKRKP